MNEEINTILDICQQRRDMGRGKYGDDDYKNKDMHEEMKQELYDIINYAIFQVLKINDLQKKCSQASCQRALDGKWIVSTRE
jgi:hypothetical protein